MILDKELLIISTRTHVVTFRPRYIRKVTTVQYHDLGGHTSRIFGKEPLVALFFLGCTDQNVNQEIGVYLLFL